MSNSILFKDGSGIKDKIRILQCIETISSGGVEQTRLTLAKHLPKDRFEIKIICTHARGPIAESLKNEGVELIAVGTMKHPLNWAVHKQVQSAISTFKPHIIHGAVFEGNSMAAISGFIKRVPCIILEETSDPQNRSSKANWLLRQLSKLAQVIIAISPDVKRYLIDKAKIKISKVRMIENGVIFPQFPSTEEVSIKKKELGLGEKHIVIGFVGRLFNDHKRITDLIEAFSMIRFPEVKLLIVGGGRDEILIKDHLKKHGIEDQVIMVGFQPETSIYYSMMDISCIPSSREGFGLVAAEAMLHQLPVVATAVGGLKNVVLDGETGFLVPSQDPPALAEKLQMLVEDIMLRHRMGKAGFNRAIEHYTADRYCQQIESLYLDLLEKKGVIVINL